MGSFVVNTAMALDGSGTREDPWRIQSLEDFNDFVADANYWDDYTRLETDVNLAGLTYSIAVIAPDINNVDYGFQGTVFTGVFDGNDHTISNFKYTSTNRYYIGLFGFVDDPNAEIKNLGLIAPDVDAGTGKYVGSLVGYLRKGIIGNCYAEGGSVSGDDYVGGLVGWNYGGPITSCYSTSSVSGDRAVGGLVGYNWNLGTITNCYSTGSVTGDWAVGGLVGWNGYSSTVNNCCSTGRVSGNNEVGGLVGLNESSGTISNCYSTGSVSGLDYVGGLVGEGTGTITNCYSTGSVSGLDYVGGLVGNNSYGGNISNCYSTGSVSGTTSVGGLLGYDYEGIVTTSFWDIETSGQTTSARGTGLTTAEMQMSATFFVWGFCGYGGVWTIEEGEYPRLAWEDVPGEPIGPYDPVYGGGTGEPDDPYLIYRAEQLNMISLFPCDWEKHFKLMANIDLSSYTGTSFNIIGTLYNPFTGVFDGNDHTISNFTYTSTNRNDIGLFGFVDGPNAEIKNLGLIAPDVNAGTGEYVGSLVGYLREGIIGNCYAEGGSVSGDYYVGGLVGGSNSGTITNCYSTVSISGDDYVGGLVGRNYGGIISNCYSTDSVTGDDYIGGLVGYNTGTISNCYSASSVTGDNYVGGLVGTGGAVLVSFWDIETSGQATSAGGIGKTTAEMQMVSTFIWWGACGNEGIWTLDEGNDYPHLWWEEKPGEFLPAYQLSDVITGAGTETDPYLIYTAEQLNIIGLVVCEWDKHFKLMADIDLSAFTGTILNIIGVDWNNPFTGVFDGNDHTISTYTSYIGLFGFVDGPNAEIKNLGMINPNVDAWTRGSVGSLVGVLWKGTVANCYVEGGSVAGRSSVGGLVGVNGYRSDVSNCYSTGSVSGYNDVGGLVGVNSGTITNCYSTGDVRGYVYVGGLVGGNDYLSSLSNCCSTGSVSGEDYVGGLMGGNIGSISNCYSTGSVSGISDVGGLVGLNNIYGIVSNCHSTGDVSGDNRVGGLVGWNNNIYGIVSNCYSIGDVNGLDYVGGLLGRNAGIVANCFWDTNTQTNGVTECIGQNGGTTTNVAGLTTAQMQTKSTFTDAGWDFIGERHNGTTETWQMPAGGGYPILSFFQINIPVPLSGNGTVNDPYLINDGNEMGMVTWYPDDCHFKLTRDIDLSGIHWSVAVVTDSHRLLNMQISGAGYLGLFGYLGDQGQVKNLGLEGGSVNGTGCLVGGLVGYNKGSFSNCYSTGNVSGLDCVGGLVGEGTGTITNCYSTGDVNGLDYVGGLVGINYNGVVSNCYSTGSVSGLEFVGGLVGYSHHGGTITNCYSTGDVSGLDYVGGLVGNNSDGTITNCHSTGSVMGISTVGGLVGGNFSYGTIINCYSTVSVSGDWAVGGLVGWNDVGLIIICYSTGEVSGTTGVGGLVGYDLPYPRAFRSFWDIQSSGQVISNGGTGLATTEMQMESTFTDAGWDFVGETDNGTEDIWTMHDGVDYPKFVWELVNFIGWDGVDFRDYSFFANRWMDSNCGVANDCDGADLDFSDKVDGADMKIFFDQWMEGVE
jgi:hypothetical protein